MSDERHQTARVWAALMVAGTVWAFAGQAGAAEASASAKPAYCAAVPAASEVVPGATGFVYGQTGERSLRIHVFQPVGAGGKKPAILLFFGGGFRTGDVSSQVDSARFLSEHGYVVAVADYRVLCRDGVTALAGIADAEAANAWLHHNARKLGIDRKRIVLDGGSAGGLLAAMTALHASTKDRPAGLVLVSPVLDLTAGVWAKDQSPADAAADSPSSLPLERLPPTLILHGTADRIVPIQSSRAFCARAVEVGRYCRLVEYPGMIHAFDGSRTVAPSLGVSPFDDTMAKSLDFLSALSKVGP